jgi:hypothetical protein
MLRLINSGPVALVVAVENAVTDMAGEIEKFVEEIIVTAD